LLEKKSNGFEWSRHALAHADALGKDYIELMFALLFPSREFFIYTINRFEQCSIFPASKNPTSASDILPRGVQSIRTPQRAEGRIGQAPPAEPRAGNQEAVALSLLLLTDTRSGATYRLCLSRSPGLPPGPQATLHSGAK